MSKSIEPHPALEYRCPFCHTEVAEPCRSRTSGKAKDRPHLQRLQLTQTVEELLRSAPKRVDALCCECGRLRTVSENHFKRADPNAGYGPIAESKGWRATQTLKCDACGTQTRHALLRPSDSPSRDLDERWQRIALGDKDTGPYGHLTDLERVRREYRQMPFPRNPYLTHRRFNADAQKAWDDGAKMVIALCGEPIEVKVDPRQADRKTPRTEDGDLVAKIISEIELTDPDTGLEWIDMDCVDCCRVSNNIRRAERRKLMADCLRWLSMHPERVPDTHVETLLAAFEALQGALTKGTSR